MSRGASKVPAGEPLLDLRDATRVYASGDEEVRALNGVSLSIYPGEFVAVMGQSGSGKSTLMNLLGCLDWPSSGSYKVHGEDVRGLDADGLARLRRETFGFIFQRYNLLATATAEENVEIPAIYAGEAKPERMARARELLGKLGIGSRADHRPGQLSGGQQQRVAIARALMNNPPVILADEPTGALDSRSGEEVMGLLKSLHAEGRTVIIITHDAKVAAHAKRQIVIHDGKIQSDSGHDIEGAKPAAAKRAEPAAAALPEVAEAGKMALRALRVNLFRTVLTLLGIIIGVASVVTMLAVGDGSKQTVLDQISSMGTNLLSVRPGGAGVRSTGSNASLTIEDVDAVAQLENVEAAVGERSGRMTVRYGNIDYATTVNGEGVAFPQVRDWPVAEGSFFNERDVRGYAPVAVLGQTVAETLFPAGGSPLGEYILIGNVPFEVVGVMADKGANPMGQDQDDAVFVPLTTGLVRLFGGQYVNGITLKVADVAKVDATQAAVEGVLAQRHHGADFRVRNTASILEMATATQNTLTILLGTVAAISLLVGGIGVMNIMLVSVTERTREIGVRMATGARQRDIMVQFITEAAVVCTLGGLVGLATGVALALALDLFGVNVLLRPGPGILAFGCAVMTGLVFGYLPARQASRKDPVVALAAE